MPFDSIGISKENLKLRTTFSYNEEGLLTGKEIFMMEHLEQRLFRDLPFENSSLLISIDAKVKYTYDYDEKNRLKKVTLFRDNQLIFYEKYTYDDQGKPIEMYVFNPSSYITNIAPHTRRILDHQGNTIEEIGLTFDGKVIDTRYYEYTYDEQGNWIQCDLYLEGKTEEPTIVGKRIITYYQD